MNVFESLVQNAGKDVIISNDTEACSLLLGLGILDKLANARTEAGAFAKPTVATVTSADHPTHYIFAVLYFGQSLPRDNGYSVWCFSRRLHTPEQADFQIEALIRSHGLKPEAASWFKIRSPKN
jgi:hypothetical protein